MDLWGKFVALTVHHFAFLETDFQFRRKDAKPPFIFYESDKIQVRVYYGHRDELDLSISKTGDDPNKVPSVGIGVLMLLTDEQAYKKYRSTHPKTEEELEIEVPRLAELLKKYGASMLTGEERDFQRLEILRSKKIQSLGP